ncbi:MAG: COX15/CtaA family protein, partial [Bdellovibrionales bacterium]|nr:COX15/CtaA family protein [Bdellovibrionales bacterium]
SQGLLGWFMVQSGLADMPDVSHYRLAAHLSLALIIFASLLWLILSINSHEESERKSSVSRGTVALSLLVVIQILYGAFIAGKKAGLGINTFPTMNGEWIPSSLFALKPIWLNFFDNNVTLQFIHRWLALGILVSVAFFIHSHWKISSGSPLRKALVLLLGATLAQCILGITTLIFIIPLPLAILHQLGGVFMVFALVYLAHTETHHRRSHLNETYKTPPISSKTCLGNSL